MLCFRSNTGQPHLQAVAFSMLVLTRCLRPGLIYTVNKLITGSRASHACREAAAFVTSRDEHCQIGLINCSYQENDGVTRWLLEQLSGHIDDLFHIFQALSSCRQKILFTLSEGISTQIYYPHTAYCTSHS